MDEKTKKEILDLIFKLKEQIDPMPIINTLNEIKMNLDRIAMKIDQDFYNKYYENSSNRIKKRMNSKNYKYFQEGGEIPLEKD